MCMTHLCMTKLTERVKEEEGNSGILPIVLLRLPCLAQIHCHFLFCLPCKRLMFCEGFIPIGFKKLVE